MNLPNPKKYIVFTLVLVNLSLTNTTQARIMSIPVVSPTTTAPAVSQETLTPVEITPSKPVEAPQVSPSRRADLDTEPGIALNKVQQARITNLAANISNRMDAATARLSNISLRLEQRIIKMEEQGIETSLAKEKLMLANEILANAKLKLSDIDTLVNSATYSTQPRRDWQIVKERYQETSSLIRQAHFELRESIMALQNPAPKSTKPDASANPTEPELIFN